MPLALKPLKLRTSQTELEHLQFNSLINNMTDAVLTVDSKARITLYNAEALNILDVNTIELKTSLGDLLKPIDKNNQAVDIEKLILETTQPAVNRDLRLQYSDGSTINLYLSIGPVHLGYGAKGKHGYVLMLRDITREKSLEEERDEFISVVSHELRTPIAISEGNVSNAQLIAEKSGDMVAIKKALKEAHNQILFLADMINDLATLSRAERGKLQVDIEPINVYELMEELANNYRPQAEQKGLELKLLLDPKLELLQSSKLYVREILQNFITNSIKYTQKGHVTLEAHPDPKGVRFAVSDTGIGISKQDQEKVFDKFFRSEDFRTAQASGTGLGLYVTMKLSNLLHADINLHSELNKGSTFSIFIPNLQ